MPQLLLYGFPDGAIRIGTARSALKKDDRVAYLVGPDNFRLPDLAGELGCFPKNEMAHFGA